MARKLVVQILGDASSLTRSFNQSTTAANAFGAQVTRSMGKAEKGFTKLQGLAGGAFIGGAALSAGVAGIKETTQAASDLGEQMSKNRVVFGTSADSVVAFSTTTADALGLSQTAALEATGTFGNLFQAVGIVGPEAANFSTQLVKLASDMASFNNASPEDVLLALRSGLTGEVEPLRRFGVLLSEARVQQEALAKTGKTSVKELTNQEKAYARIAIIMRDTTTAQGDFARTSGSLANQQRILAAQVQELKVNLGKGLLPVMTSLTEFTAKAVVAVQDLGSALEWLGRQKITPLQIPINFTIVSDQGGGDLKAGDIFKFRIDEIVGLGIDAALGRGVFGKGERKVKSTEVTAGAKAFDDAFTPFTDSLVKTGQDAAERAGKKVKDALSKGSKMLDSNELGESLQRQFDSTLDALDLKFDQATFAENTSGALAALDQIEAAVRRRITTEGRTTELLRLLFQVDQDRAAVIAGAKQAKKDRTEKVLADKKADAERLRDRLRELARARQEAREAGFKALETQQFRQLGLGAGGEEFIPGLKNLRKQFAQLSDSVVGQDVPAKLLSKMKLVGKALMDPDLQPEVRKWINDLFGTIRGTFNDEQNKGVGLKPRGAQLSDKILAALGFTEEIDARRIQKFTQARGAAAPRVTTAAGAPAGAAGGVVISGPITVVADNPDAFLRELQKKAGRQTATSRGRFPGRSMGLG